MLKIIIKLLCIIIVSYLIFCGILYHQQEKFIFHPHKLPKNYQFQFYQTFKEILIHTEDNINIHGLLFTADSSRGLIFYLHGNAGALNSWGNIAKIYTDLNYDIFILDYRGFGKSEGTIYSRNQFHSDIQLAYDSLAGIYPENKIVIIGFSIATGPAARLAAKNHPRKLILLAPYYSLIDIVRNKHPYLPYSLLKYNFKTYKFLKKTSMPVAIFHGNKDEVILYESSLKLKSFLKPGDIFIILDEQNHQGIDYNNEYRKKLRLLLTN